MFFTMSNGKQTMTAKYPPERRVLHPGETALDARYRRRQQRDSEYVVYLAMACSIGLAVVLWGCWWMGWL